MSYLYFIDQDKNKRRTDEQLLFRIVCRNHLSKENGREVLYVLFVFRLYILFDFPILQNGVAALCLHLAAWLFARSAKFTIFSLLSLSIFTICLTSSRQFMILQNFKPVGRNLFSENISFFAS
jgi:hypothetical protein